MHHEQRERKNMPDEGVRAQKTKGGCVRLGKALRVRVRTALILCNDLSRSKCLDVTLCLHETWVRARMFSESAWANTVTLDPLRHYHTNKIKKRSAPFAILQWQIPAESGDGENQINRSQDPNGGPGPRL